MIKLLPFRFLPIFTCLLIAISTLSAQQVVFNEDFSQTQSSTYTTSGPIGSSIWTVARSGQDFGARISGGMLTLINDATSASNPTGWVSATTSTSNFDDTYNPILSQNAGIVSWTFNMRQIRTNPRGFEFGQYGVAIILAGTPGSNVNTGKGWALVLGNSGTTDPIRLVAYSNGLKTFSTKLSSKGSGFTDFGREYTSARVDYNPADNRWTLYLRKDGSTFQNPKSGTLTFQETWIHTDFVNEPLTIMGGYWSAATTRNQTAFFDNISVSVQKPEIISIDPDSKIAGTAAFTMTVNGKGFLPGSKVQWNGQDRPTTYVSATQIKAAIPASDIVLSGTANVQVKNNAVFSNAVIFDIEPSGAPILTLSKNSLPTFNTTQGTASTKDTYTISGNNLQSGATLTAPSQFEMSVGTSTTYSNPLPLPNTGGGLTGQPLTINVRVKELASAGVYSGNITNSATGAVTKLVAVSAKVLALEPTSSATAVNFSNITSTGMTVNWTSGNGSERIVLIKEASAVNVLPVDGTNYTGNSTFAAGSEIGTGNFVIYKGSVSSVTVNGLNPATTYHVSVIEFNGPANAENYRTGGATGSQLTLNSPAGLQVKVANTSYKIDFDSTVDGVNLGEFQGAGIAKIAEPGQLDSDSWQFKGFEGGDVNFGGNSLEETSYENGTSDGDVDETGIYAFNVSETAENYTLGIKPGASDFNPGTITLRLHNRTSAAITSLNIGYKVYIKNVENSSTKVSFSHKLESVTSYSGDVTIVDVVSEAAADLNPSWKAYYRVVTLTGLNIPADKYYNLRWSGSLVSGTGAQDEFGIDDIEVIANPTTNVVAFDGIAEDFVLQGNANLSADLSVQNRLIFNGGKLAVKDITLTIAGNVTNTTANGLIGGSTSNVVVRGTKNPILNFDQTTVGTSNVLQNFSVIGANANTVYLANALVVNQLLAIDELQVLDLGQNTLNGTLNSILNNGLIKTQNTTTTPFASGKSWGGTGVLQLNATAAQTLVAGTYNNLRLSSAAGTTAVANVTVNGNLNLPAANASATKGSLHMATFTLTMGADGINTGIGDVTGIIKRDFFADNKTYTFGHPNSSITFPPAGTRPSTMSAKLTIGTAPTWKVGTILRQFDIIHTGAVDTKAIIRQHYLDSELNGNVESKLVFWAHTVSPSSIFDQGRSNNNLTENWVEISNANVGLYFKNTFDQVYITLDEGAVSDLTWNGSVSDSWITTANWTPQGVPSAETKVLIPNVSTGSNRYPVIDATSSVKTITIDAGAVVNTPANSVLNIFEGAGAWQNNGIFNPGNGTVIFNNLDATISGNTTFNNLTIAAGAGIRALEGNYMSVAGTLTNNGTMFTTLIPNTIEFVGTNQTIPAPGGEAFGGYHNLIVSGTGATIASSTLNVRGNLTLNQEVPFTGKTINLAGISNQTIGGTAVINFNNLIVNKETGAVILANNIVVSNTFTLTKGNIVLNTKNLTLGTNEVAGSFSTNTMIVADGTGLVRRPFSSVGSYFFPIGENIGAPSYSPITVNVTAGTFSNAFVEVNVKNLKHPNNNSSQNYLRKYWNVQQTGITSAVATIAAQYEPLDAFGAESEIAAAQLNGTFNVASNPWIKFGTLSNNTLTATNATLTSGQPSIFTGIKAGDLSVEVYGYGEFCKDSEALLTAEVVGGDAPYTYIWSNGLANSQTVQAPTSIVGITNYSLTVRDANGFTATDNNIPVEILPESFGGTIANNVQQICAGTSPADLVLNGSIGNVLYWQKSTVADFSTFQNLSVFTTTISASEIGPLNETTYFRAVLQSGNCGESISEEATITIKSSTWNGMSWSNGNPDSVTTAIFEANYTATASINACNVIVKNGAIVTIPSGFTVTANGAVQVESGSLTFENNANLIQTAEVQNSGNIVVKRNSSALKRLDYTLWSSPVGNQPLFSFSPQTTATRFYSYNSEENIYSAISISPTTVFDRAKGYLIRMPNNHPATVPTIWNGSFTGVPHNGTITVPLQNFGTGKRFNLVGNPYPSPIDARLFVENVTNAANITGTIYFWRKTNDATQPSYYTWTTLGLVAPETTDQTVVANNNNVIQTGQGFFVEANENATSFVFNNAMRKDDHANQFFKATTEATEYNRIWLNATNAEGWFSQTLIGYFSNGVDGSDSSDGRYINDGDIAFSSLIENVPYAIQGKSLPFNPFDVVPMFLKVKNAGNYTIAIDHVDGIFLGSQEIFLRDNLLEITHNLKSAAYTFASQAGSFDSRFEVVYQNASLSVDNPTFNANSVILYKKANEVVINAGNTILEHVEVFDIRGRLLANAKKINATEVSINVGEVNQVLIVKITSRDGITVSKKTVN